MSVYSGFATRQQQKKYNDYLQTTLSAVFKRVIKFYAGQPCDQHKFKHLMQNLHDRMFTLEQGKFMQPKFSYLLANFLKKLDCILLGSIEQNEDNQLTQSFLELQKPSKIRINTIQESRLNEMEDLGQKMSRKSSNSSIVQFRRKIRTVNNYDTTPVIIQHQHDQNNRSSNSTIIQEINNKLNHHLYEVESSSMPKPVPIQKKSKHKSRSFAGKIKLNQFKNLQSVMKAPKLQHFIPKKMEISPREYLKQTIMGKFDRGDNKIQKNEHLNLRTKQKHQRLID